MAFKPGGKYVSVIWRIVHFWNRSTKTFYKPKQDVTEVIQCTIYKQQIDSTPYKERFLYLTF